VIFKVLKIIGKLWKLYILTDTDTLEVKYSLCLKLLRNIGEFCKQQKHEIDENDENNECWNTLW
jgi:hypothetical protein